MPQNFCVLVHLREHIGSEYTFMAEPSHSQFSFYCCVQMVFDLNSIYFSEERLVKRNG
jgi:hypothetical protein